MTKKPVDPMECDSPSSYPSATPPQMDDSEHPSASSSLTLPSFPPKPRSKYISHKNLSTAETVALRREQNRLAAKRCRQKKQKQKEIISKQLCEIRMAQTENTDPSLNGFYRQEIDRLELYLSELQKGRVIKSPVIVGPKKRSLETCYEESFVESPRTKRTKRDVVSQPRHSTPPSDSSPMIPLSALVSSFGTGFTQRRGHDPAPIVIPPGTKPTIVFGNANVSVSQMIPPTRCTICGVFVNESGLDSHLITSHTNVLAQVGHLFQNGIITVTRTTPSTRFNQPATAPVIANLEKRGQVFRGTITPCGSTSAPMNFGAQNSTRVFRIESVDSVQT